MLKTLDRALSILQFFTKEKSSWGVRELAKEMDINHSVIYRTLKTFENHGFLKQNISTEKYEIGSRFFEFGIIAQELFPIGDQLNALMKELCGLVGESIFLTWLDGYEGFCLDYAESQNSIKFTVERGSRTPLYAGANNRVIMAHLQEREIDNLIAQGLTAITTETIIEAKELKKDLDLIRTEGYAYTIGEFDKHVTGLAIPLFDKNNKIIASLTIAGPSYRIGKSKIQEFLPLLKKAGLTMQPLIKQYRFKDK